MLLRTGVGHVDGLRCVADGPQPVREVGRVARAGVVRRRTGIAEVESCAIDSTSTGCHGIDDPIPRPNVQTRLIRHATRGGRVFQDEVSTRL